MNILLSVVLGFLVIAGIGWLRLERPSTPPPFVTEQNEERTDTTNIEPPQQEKNSATTLNVSGKELTQVPTTIFADTGITELDLSNNKLTGALPGEIRHLQNLEILDLSNNQFTGVPAEIGQLASLRILDLSNNQLTGLPNELGNLSNLAQLDLRGNNYSEADLANIRKILPSTAVVLVD